MWNVDCRLVISALTPRSSITFNKVPLTHPSQPLSNLSATQERTSPTQRQTPTMADRQTDIRSTVKHDTEDS